MIGLQFAYEPEFADPENVEYEKFPDAEVKEEKVVAAEEEEAPPEGGEPKKEAFKPELYVWTVASNKAVNLP